MNRLFNRHPFVIFLLLGALIGSSTALFFPALRWPLFLISSLAGLAIGFLVQKSRRSVSQLAAGHVVAALEPELQPVPEPVTCLFLYNTLHNIAALVLFDPVRASKDIENLANFVRTVTEMKRSNQTFLGEEFKAVDLYLTIEKSRLGDRLVVKKQFSHQCYEIPFPSLILFPYIDGCIRYSAELQTSPVTVMLACRQAESSLVLEVADHVDESDDETWPPASRDAIYSQMKRRLLEFYGSSAKISRSHLQPAGESIKISIPLGNAKIGRSARREVTQDKSDDL
ncbi:histidine kinase [candidate division KSB1 bacterium]|nr:histidine kinase [candidate division KSB1 bacterium]